MKSEYKRIYAFDWDDNIIQMPTKIFITKKGSDPYEEIEISTEDFALERRFIGDTGKYADYEIITDEKAPNFSFRKFRDEKGKNLFLEDFKKEYNKRNTNYKRSWNALVHALSSKDTAENVSIITARGHSPQRIYEVFKFLQEEKIIKNIPKRRNIFPVAYINKDETIDVSLIKARIIENILDTFTEELEGNSYNSYHKFSFSDDDVKTIKFLAKYLGERYKNKRWKKFIIHLFYTGTDDSLKMGSYVIGFGGELLFRKPFHDYYS